MTHPSGRRCSFPDCGAPVGPLYGLCPGHITQQRKGQPLRPILRGEAARFWAKVEKTETCWNWTGGKNAKGYGYFTVNARTTKSHRWAWESSHGPIPDGLTIDHLCRNTSCVNPDHLEVVDNRTNTLRGGNRAAENARKTHCINGHEFTEDNIYWHQSGASRWRRCRTCALALDRKRAARLR